MENSERKIGGEVPYLLAERLVRDMSAPLDTVIVMGGELGTTELAALYAGRHVISIVRDAAARSFVLGRLRCGSRLFFCSIFSSFDSFPSFSLSLLILLLAVA